MASLSTTSSLRSDIDEDGTGDLSRRLRRWPEVLLLVISGSVYFWNITVNGWGNPYYAAAAQAGSTDWVALLFGSADAGKGLTVDKPPLHLWVLALSVKSFGLSPLSVLAPQALMGMATVWLVQRSAQAWGSPRQAFIAGLFVVFTPVTSIIFRFNNPDALLLLLWALSAFLLVKSVEKHAGSYLYISAFILGLAFLCKQFQSWILVPAIAAAFLTFGFGGLMSRLRRLIFAAVVMILPAAIWIAIAELTPASRRPWIGGSVSNSFLELTFGYNGFGRLTGQSQLGAVNPKDFQGVVGYDAGVLRLLTINYAPEVAWFLPVAFVGAVFLAVSLYRRRSSRIQSLMSLLLLVWFATTFTVLSFMTGDIHPYYTCMLAIPMACLSAHAIETFWVNRTRMWFRRGAALLTLLCLLVTSGILTWFQDWQPWAGSSLKVGALLAATILGLSPSRGRLRTTTDMAHVLAAATILLVPFLFVVESIQTPQQGSFPISGPVPSVESWHRRDAEQLRLDERGKYSEARGEPVIPQIASLLEGIGPETTWAAATTGSQNAALYQLATGRAVMSIGGFTTGDVYPPLNDFQRFVAEKRIAYYIHQPGILEWAAASPNTHAVVSWIEGNFTSEDIDGVRLYDLRRPLD
jgi:4-amino-4-deoxy-L-arabinose transferase-like glycosyltransferase